MPRPRIIVLDSYTLNPGDISWSPIEAIGNLTLHDRTPDALIAQRATGAPVVLTNKTKITAEIINALPDLKYIGVLATGTNVVDLKAARERGVPVTNVPGYGTESVAQWTIALLLELVCHTSSHGMAVHQGDWTRCEDFSFTVAPITELAGKTFGVIGLGAIGQRVARIAAALGMNIAASHQRTMNQVKIHGVDIAWMPVDELFATADVLSLHCPLTDQTRNIVNVQRIAKMKPTAILLNTSRGPLVDEAALAAALRDGKLAAAGLDVLSVEPPTASNPLLSAPKCLLTPHTAWASVEARTRLMHVAADNMKAFLAGKPKNVVN